MKILNYGAIITALALTGCKPKQENAASSSSTPASDANSIKITSSSPSPHFAEVMSHLDVGGKSLHFDDHEGRRDFWVALIDGIVKAVPKEELPIKIDAGKLIDESGLMTSAASGRSLTKEDKGWLVRSYTSYPNGVPDIMKMLGDKEAFITGSRLPASTDISVEAQLNASILPDLMRRFGKILGQDEAVEKGLKEVTPVGASLETLLAGMDLNILLGVDLEPTLVPKMPVMPQKFFAQVSAKKELIDVMMPMLSEGLGEATALDNMKAWPLPFALPTAAEGIPHLIYDGATTLSIVSSLDHFKEIRGTGKKLGDQPHFKAATNHFASSGNLLVYASPAVAKAAVKWIAVAAETEPDSAPLIRALESIDTSLPWAFYLSCEDKGVVGMAEVPYAPDSSSVTTLTMLSATSTLFIGARSWKNGSDRAACIMNIRNVQQAIRGHQNMNQISDGAVIDWDKIVGDSDDAYLPKPVCPLGGTYTFSKVYPKPGQLACTCSHADHVPSNHESW